MTVRDMRAVGVSRIAVSLLGLLACAEAAALWCDTAESRARVGCNGTGESAEWRLEHVDTVTTEHPGHYVMRAVRKSDGASTMLRVSTLFKGQVEAIQVYRSHALVHAPAGRGIYEVTLLNLAKPAQVASFLAYDIGKSPDDRYLRYRIAYNAWSPGEARVMLLDLQGLDESRLMAGRAGCDIMAPCAVEVGSTAYELPSEDDWLGGRAWDLENRRLLLTVPDGDGRSVLVAVSLAGERPEVVCRIPIHELKVQGEFSAPLRRYVLGLSYESAEDIAVVKVADQSGVRSDYWVSLAEACAVEGAR